MISDTHVIEPMQKFSARIEKEQTKHVREQASFSQNIFSAETTLAKKKNSFIKRVSPFMLLTFTFLFLFPYMMITGAGNIHNEWAKAIIFPFAVINLLFADFAIWNYFGGRKRGIIWLIEMVVSIGLLYFII